VLFNLANALGMTLSELSKVAEDLATARRGASPETTEDLQTTEYTLTITALQEQINELEKHRAHLEQSHHDLTRLNRDQALIIDAIPAMIWLKDKENRILRVNARAAKATGLSKAEIEGQSTYALYPDLATKYHQDDLEVISTGRPKFGIIEPHAPGTQPAHEERRWVRTDKFPYKDDNGDIVGVIVFAVDVTEYQATHDALLETKKNMEKMLSRLNDKSGANTV
jgi:PAS domain S-box-containing protein